MLLIIGIEVSYWTIKLHW